MAIVNRPVFDLVTFTRASSATRYNAYGVLETVGANVPRLDHDPVTLSPVGLRLSSAMAETATLDKTAAFYRADTGTWIVDGEYNAATLINGAVAGISGRGKLVVTYSAGVANIHSDTDLMFSAPLQSHANIPLIISGIARLERCRFYPFVPANLSSLVPAQQIQLGTNPIALGSAPLVFKSNLSH